MMHGINELARMTAGHQLDPVVLHRFLIHHLLRQAGFTPKGVVLPISARMLSRIGRYSELLKAYSRPRTDLVNYRLDADNGTVMVTSPQPHWLYAYFNAMQLCELLPECVQETVEVDLASEVRYLRSHDSTVRELEAWLDLPQSRLNTRIEEVVSRNFAGTSRRRRERRTRCMALAAKQNASAAPSEVLRGWFPWVASNAQVRTRSHARAPASACLAIVPKTKAASCGGRSSP